MLEKRISLLLRSCLLRSQALNNPIKRPLRGDLRTKRAGLRPTLDREAASGLWGLKTALARAFVAGLHVVGRDDRPSPSGQATACSPERALIGLRSRSRPAPCPVLAQRLAGLLSVKGCLGAVQLARRERERSRISERVPAGCVRTPQGPRRRPARGHSDRAQRLSAPCRHGRGLRRACATRARWCALR